MSNYSEGEELSIPIGTGVSFAAKAYGPPNSNRRVIALHGWIDNANSFDVLAPALAEAGIRVVCLDFIGHGHSIHKALWTNLYYTDYVTQVLDVVDALGWKTFTLLGHSMGAGISSILAACVPHMVEKVICLDFIGILSKEQDQVRAMKYAIQSREKLINRKPHLYPSKLAIFDKLKTNNPFITDDAARKLLERSIETIIAPNGDQMYKLRHDPRLIGPSIFTMREGEVVKVLQEIKCPVLLIWGTVSAQQFTIKRDWTSIMENRMRCVKNLKVMHVDGSHHFHMEKISLFISDLIEFIFADNTITYNPDVNFSFPQTSENHNQLAEAANSEQLLKEQRILPKVSLTSKL